MLTLAFQVAALTTSQHGRSLSYAQILSYSPGSQVTDHSSKCNPMRTPALTRLRTRTALLHFKMPDVL
jgi:hypothetical protein